MRSVGQWFLTILRKLDRLASVFFGMLGGLAFAQFPQFIAQYLQRLGGHIDEARLAAKIFRLPVLAVRADDLSAGLSAIENASSWSGIPTFLTHAQWTIAREAWRHYKPGMTFARDELIYLAAGALVGVMVYGLIKMIVHGLWKAGRFILQRTSASEPPDANQNNNSIEL